MNSVLTSYSSRLFSLPWNGKKSRVKMGDKEKKRTFARLSLSEDDEAGTKCYSNDG